MLSISNIAQSQQMVSRVAEQVLVEDCPQVRQEEVFLTILRHIGQDLSTRTARNNVSLSLTVVYWRSSDYIEMSIGSCLHMPPNQAVALRRQSHGLGCMV